MPPSQANEFKIKNPHSILAVLQMRPRDVVEVMLPREKNDETWQLIQALAEKNKIRMREGQGDGFNRKVDTKNFGRESPHGALVRAKTAISVEKVFENVTAATRGVWLALDCLQDPQNIGAIFRSAAFFGVKGILITTERSAQITNTVYDIASGGMEAVPFVSVINLQRAFEKAKEAGLWILGTSEHAKTPLSKIQNDRPWLVVIGNEEKGLRHLTLESCDMTCAIPARGEIVTSLNVSVATGVLLSHLS